MLQVLKKVKLYFLGDDIKRNLILFYIPAVVLVSFISLLTLANPKLLAETFWLFILSGALLILNRKYLFHLKY